MAPNETVEQFAERNNTTIQAILAGNENGTPSMYRIPVRGKWAGESITPPAKFDGQGAVTYGDISKKTGRSIGNAVALQWRANRSS
jgi:hypothetical protein